MRIALVHTWPAEAGSEPYEAGLLGRELALLRELRVRHGHEVAAWGCSFARSSTTVESPAGPPLWYEPVDALGPRLDGVGSSALRSAVATWQPDLLLVKGIGTELSAQLTRMAVAPVGFIIGGRQEGPELPSARFFLTENDEQDDLYRRIAPGRPTIRLAKLVDDAFFASHPIGEAPAVGRRYDVVSVGGMHGWKNHIALLPLARQGYAIALVGDGPLRPALERQFAETGGSTSFLGRLDTPAVAEVLRASRLLVHPSLSEGFPRAVAEAMAVGLPCVAVAGVVGEPLVDGVNGRVTTPDQLATAVGELLADEPTMRRMGLAARELARERFSVAAVHAVVDPLHDIARAAVAAPAGVERRRRVGSAIRYQVHRSSVVAGKAQARLRRAMERS